MNRRSTNHDRIPHRRRRRDGRTLRLVAIAGLRPSGRRHRHDRSTRGRHGRGDHDPPPGVSRHRRRERRHPRRPAPAATRHPSTTSRGCSTLPATARRASRSATSALTSLARACSRRPLPARRATSYGTDYFDMDFSGGGDVTAPVTVVDVNLAGDRASTSGCEVADFAGFPAGHIALIQRGTCTFAVKVDNAVAAGASGCDHLQPGQRRARRRPLRSVRRHARPAGAHHPGRQRTRSTSARSGRPPRGSRST